MGLGNFESLFAQYRNRSANSNRAIHPESDWLWLTIEAGWLAPVLALAAFGWVARRCWPFGAGTDRALRSAALVCSGLFVLHGFFDVSGHRIGTLWPALFLLGLSVNSSWSAVRTLPRWAGIAPLLVGAIGAMLAFAALRMVSWPSTVSLAELKREMQAALDQKKFSTALPLASEALRIAPLDWELYFARGTARALTEPATGLATADFALARQLEPNPVVAFETGRVWLTRDQEYVEKNYFLGREPERAAEAWRELLERHPGRAGEFFDQMLNLASRYPEVLPHLHALARVKPQLLLAYASSVSGPEFDEAVRELLAAQPGLKFASAVQLRRFFKVWAQHGDTVALEKVLRENPSWLEFGWVALGEVLERRGEFERACSYARSYVPRAQLPASPGGITVAAAWAAYSSRPRDVAAGIVYVQKLIETDGKAEALRVLRILTALPEAPAYLLALQADLAYDLREFEAAWTAWKRGAPR